MKRALGVKKAGHAGTLDPMATGLLIVGIGRATRLLGYLAGEDKQYLATVRFGQASTTDDAEGEPLGVPVAAGGISPELLQATMAAYVGEIEQIPSAVSAIKVDGKRAYALVRQGVDVELKPRKVTVSRFELLNQPVAAGSHFLDVDVLVDCSSGTYIRALARDLGRDLGVGAHLTALRRTRIGSFSVADALTPEAVHTDAVIELATVAKQVFPFIETDAAQAAQVRYGRRIQLRVPANPTAIIHAGEFLALYRGEGDEAVPVAVFVS